MKKLLIFGIFLYVSLHINAKATYYYYNGGRMPISVSDDSIRIYSLDNTKTNRDGKKEFVFSSRISPMNYNQGNESLVISSKEYIVKGDAGHMIQMSNRFYVQLFDSNDYQKLLQIADEVHAEIIGPVPYTKNWYKLVVNNSKIDNSLEMSNYFYETGLFKNIDPGFVFNFRPSCVSDSHFSDQWGLPAIHACDAWNISKGDSSIVIAIVDKGVYTQHTEFANTQFVNPYNCLTQDSISYTVYGDHGTGDHGTFICGEIAADHNHAEISGLAPHCKIMPISHPLRISDDISEELASGIAWATIHGADVINCSWGDQGGQYYEDLHSTILESTISDALTDGRNGKGCVVVFAAGNYNSSQLDYPAYVYPDILTVGAIDTTYHRSYFSSYGNNLDIVAPGSNIYSTKLYNQYGNLSGTSFSAPYAAAVAGLMLSVNPDLTRNEIVNIIESTAKKIGGYDYTTHVGHPNGTWNYYMGYGLVDAFEAVRYVSGYNEIQNSFFVCDTTKYYLRYPSYPGTVINWSLQNPTSLLWDYSLIGPTNQDTILVTRTYGSMIPLSGSGVRNTLPDDSSSLRGIVPILSVSITTPMNQSYTTNKVLETPTDNYPNCTVDSTGTWYVGHSRTFTVTNCLDEPDSAFLWVAKRRFSSTTTTHRGRTFTFTPTSFGSYTISVTNTNSECGYATVNYKFDVNINLPLHAAWNNDQLNIEIVTEGDDIQNRDASNNYTLELWHVIFGRMYTGTMNSYSAQINTQDFPQGTYVVVLKDNGKVVAQTKVQK